MYLVDEINLNIDRINKKMKEKYSDVDWNVVEKRKYYEFEDVKSMKLGKVIELSFRVLYDELYDKLNLIFEK
mgnify:CR=1 FL=1